VRRFKTAVADDLNMPQALAAVNDALKPGAVSPASQLAMLQEADKVLGLKLVPEGPQELAAELQALVDRRAQARKDKNFEQADQLRKELAVKGILVEDTKDGQRWKKK
jgi:cysteinyl-tRNA synthetase